MAHMISKLESSSTELEKLMKAKSSIEANELKRVEATLDRAIELTQLFTQAAIAKCRLSYSSQAMET